MSEKFAVNSLLDAGGLSALLTSSVPPLHRRTLWDDPRHRPYHLGGKTTTLYAVLQRKQETTVDKIIIATGDPAEDQPKGITQIPVNEKKGLTFARGLRSILRHDRRGRSMVG